MEKKINIAHFESREGRQIDNETLVGVHWNAHKNCWSIVSMKSRHTTGLVLGYCREITLRDVTTHIDKSKQKKVIESGKKDRHAFIVGYIEDLEFEAQEKNLYYSPKKVTDFVDAEKFFKYGTAEQLGSVNRASLKWNYENNHPVVQYA